MAYWYYRGVVPYRAVIHADWCGECQHGHGKSGKGMPTIPEKGWAGPYATVASARRPAQQADGVPADRVRPCERCLALEGVQA
jgi:hypothetical protein